MEKSETEQTEVVYTPQSPLTDPARLLSAQWADLKRSRELAVRLLKRNLSARYRQTLLGYFWAVFPMVATTAVWLLLLRRNVIAVEMPIGSPVLFLLIGMMLWQTFVDAVQAPLRVVSESKSMLAKINFPREALLLTALGEVLVNFAIRLIIVIAAWIWFAGDIPSATFWFVPLGVLSIILFGTTIGVLLVPLGILYQDVMHGLAFLFQVWLFATPVLYPTPTGWSHGWIAWLNPIGPLINTTRDWLMVGASDQVALFCTFSALTLIVVCFGMLLYRVAMPILLERMQS